MTMHSRKVAGIISSGAEYILVEMQGGYFYGNIKKTDSDQSV